MEYLLKVRYIVLVDLNEAGFLISNTVFFVTGWKRRPMSEKYNYKNEWHLRLVPHIVTKLSQNVYLVNTRI